MLSIKVNNAFLDLLPDNIIQLDFAINEIGNIESSRGAKTNDFDFLGTAKNKKTLGFSDSVQTTERFQYLRQDAILLDNNTEIAKGFLQITAYNREDNIFTASFYSSNVDWFVLAKDLDIKFDVDWSDTSHTWNRTEIFNAQSYTSDNQGYCYPIIWYGQSNAGVGITFDEAKIFPAAFTFDMMKRGFQKLGYKLEGSFLNDFYFKREIVPYSLDKYPSLPESQVVANQVIAIRPETSTVTENSEPFLIQTTQEIQDEQNQWVTDTFTAGTAGNWIVTLAIDFGSVDPNDGDVELNVRKNGTIVSGTPYTVLPNTTVNISETIELAVSDTIDFQVQYVGVNPFVEVEYDNVEVNIYLSDVLEPGQVIQVDYFMPDLKLSDLMKDLANRYALLFQVDNYTKTVTIDSFKTIKNNLKNAIDWTDKIDFSKEIGIDFTDVLSNYAQRNVMMYGDVNEEDQYILQFNKSNEVKFGNGYLLAQNEYLDFEQEYYTSLFSPSYSINNGLKQYPYIKLFDENDEATLVPELRVCYFLEDTYANLNVIINNGVNDSSNTSSYTWFARNLGLYLQDYDRNLSYTNPAEYSTSIKGLLDTHYEELQAILKNPRKLTIYLRIYPEDLINLDFTIPVYLAYPFYSYFYISKIEGYENRNKPTKCELVQIIEVDRD